MNNYILTITTSNINLYQTIDIDNIIIQDGFINIMAGDIDLYMELKYCNIKYINNNIYNIYYKDNDIELCIKIIDNAIV